jgi:Flp pilus assembly protein TadD
MIGLASLVPVAALFALGSAGAVSAAGPGAIQGKVVDEQGNPLAGVQVVVTTDRSSTPMKATTKKKGTFIVRTPDRGLVYEVRCRLDGFAEVVAMVPPTTRDVDFVVITMSRAATPDSTVEPALTNPRPTPQPSTAENSEQRRAAIPVFNDGVEALQAGDLAAARASFEEASRLDPEFPEPHRALAAIAMEREDYAGAADAAERLLELQSDDLEAMRTVYFASVMLGDTARVATSARQVLAADPTAAESELMEHARSLFEQNLFELSRAVLEALTEQRPALAEAQYLLGLCCNSLGDSARARGAFAAFLELAPDHPDADSARSLLEYLQ